MSAKVQGWVWDLDLPAPSKLLLLWLANRATDAGVCFPTKRELSHRTGLSERMVRYHLEALAADRDCEGAPRAPVLSIIERRVAADRNTSNVYVICVPWAAPETVRSELNELKHVPGAALKGVGTTGCTQVGGDDGLHPLGTTGCTQVGTTGCTENRSPEERHRLTPPRPPTDMDGRQQQGGVVAETKTTGPRPTTEPGPTPKAEIQTHFTQDDAPEELANAFYRGLGANAAGVTTAIRRRDVAIARDLIAAGATASEAEAYARETSTASGRIAPVDLRSFERERLGWLARRRGTKLQERKLIDRTGLPPSWRECVNDQAPTPSRPEPKPPGEHALPSATPPSELAGSHLGDTLRALLVRAPA